MNKKIICLACLSALPLVALTSCSSGSEDKKTISSPFVDTKKSGSNSPRNTISDSPYINNPNYVENPKFNATAKKEFYSLSTIGSIDLANPDKYLSPRWNYIVGEDAPIGVVPISELDKAINSSLDTKTFNQLRELAISVSRAKVTGEGKEAYPGFFSNTPVSSCTLYKVLNAGVTTLPITSDSTWAMAIVISNAKCPQGESLHFNDKLDFYDTIYFNQQNGKWIALTADQLPRS